jgi:hypothetical protein
MRASLNVVDGVGVGINLIAVTVVVLEGDIDDDVGIEVRIGRRSFAMEGDGLLVENVFILVQEADVFGDAVFKDKYFGLVDALIRENDLNALD